MYHPLQYGVFDPFVRKASRDSFPLHPQAPSDFEDHFRN